MRRLAQLVISSLAYWFGGTGKEERSHWTGILISASDSTHIVFSVTKAPGIHGIGTRLVVIIHDGPCRADPERISRSSSAVGAVEDLSVVFSASFALAS